MNTNPLRVCFLVWVAVVVVEAFIPISTSRPVQRTDSLAIGSDDFAKIFGKEEAFERMREEAANYVPPSKRGAGDRKTEPVADVTNTTKAAKYEKGGD